MAADNIAAIEVSIHAPARGATLIHLASFQGFRGFNPRPRTGGDQIGQTLLSPAVSFNPRPRTGGDKNSHMH